MTSWRNTIRAVKDNALASEKWVRAIFARASQLSGVPESGRHLVETARRDLRELVWGNYIIIYRVETRQVAALTVRHIKQILPVEDLK